jgi:adenosine kinase
MNHAAKNRVGDAAGITIGIISPDGRDGMLEHAAQFKTAKVPFIFDPGQGMPMFDGDDLKQFVEQATWVTLNDYECELMQDRTGWSSAEIAARVDALIVTRGADGSHVYADGELIEIPAAATSSIVDPTGCGDAYRAGLLYGLMNGFGWHVSGRIASLCGAIKIESAGTQNHTFTRAEFAARYAKSFGQTLNW